MYSERGLGKCITEVKFGDKSEIKYGYMAGIAQLVKQRAICLTARVREEKTVEKKGEWGLFIDQHT
jgi:hypothetical protein